MFRRNIKSLPLFILISSGLLNAQVVPGRWEKVDLLPSGQEIIVTLKAGDRMECDFKGADSTKLTVTRGGSELAIPKADVAAIVQQKPRSSTPTLIGIAVGGVAGAGFGYAASKNADETYFARADIMALTVGVIGAVSGAFVGYYSTAEPPDEVLYQAP